MNYQMDYFYGHEANQFTFFRIPKLLFSDERFIGLTSDAKLLYALLLDRMSLSLKNGWVDDENRVYIYYTVKEVMEELNIAREKCSKIFAELDSEKGCGLILKIRQGLGRPDIIYVMNFLSYISDEDSTKDTCDNYQEDDKEIENFASEGENSRNSKIETQEVRKSNFLNFENQKSRVSEIKSLDFRKSKTNNNDYNNNKNNNTDFSDNNPISSYQHREQPKKKDVIDEIEEREDYKELIADNIEYEFVVRNYSQGAAEGILETMLDAVCSKREYLVVSGAEIPQAVVKSRLLKLDYSHVEYVLDCLKKNATKIHNIKSYMLTALYNSFSTMDHYYTAEVNHDLYGNI